MKIIFAVNPDGTEICTNDAYFGIDLFRRSESLKDLIKEYDKKYEYLLKEKDYWCNDFSKGYYSIPIFNGTYLPKGTIKKLTGKEITWKDNPIKIEF